MEAEGHLPATPSVTPVDKRYVDESYNQCWSTRVQYSYSSTTRVPFFEYSYSYSEPQVLGWYSYSKVNVLGTRSKKEPSIRVHLVFAKSNKQNEFLIVNCSQ